MKIITNTFTIFSIMLILGFSIVASIPQDGYSLRNEDYDSDGIPDSLDSCPKISENYNRFEDMDGCPDSVYEKVTKYQFPDTDGDGIEDRFDSCVEEAENINGFLDNDGCPEIVAEQRQEIIDSDLDSIPDSRDACPLQMENFNNFRDTDGCPDELKSDSETFSSNVDQCREPEVMVVRSNHNDSICVPEDTANKWVALGIAEIGEPNEFSEEESAQEIELTTQESSKDQIYGILPLVDPYFDKRPAHEKKNIERVLLLFSAFSPWNDELVSSILSDDYVQHNPTLIKDKLGTIEYFNQTSFIIPLDSIQFEIKRIYADNDYVITQSYFKITNEVNSSVIDIFKLDAGKITEHWTVMQEIPENSINENTMFYLD